VSFVLAQLARGPDQRPKIWCGGRATNRQWTAPDFESLASECFEIDVRAAASTAAAAAPYQSTATPFVSASINGSTACAGPQLQAVRRQSDDHCPRHAFASAFMASSRSAAYRRTAVRFKNGLDVKEIVNLWAGGSAAVRSMLGRH
jgi:hypothetical protein